MGDMHTVDRVQMDVVLKVRVLCNLSPDVRTV